MERDPISADAARQAAGEPPEPPGTLRTAEGTVLRWRDEQGTGVIASTATAPWDIWCHFSALDMPGFRSLTPGDRVAVEFYRADQESFRYVARRVRRLDPGPSAAETTEGTG
ncbi:cold-shock protein [Roseisolibacter agri]|nr:cold shock domain-containing protein [Roseisolibacter agri]